MKALLVLAIILAVIGVGFLVATMFVSGGSLVTMTIGSCLSLAAFIILLVAYINKSVK